jgi:integrase/recombinase XerD
MASRRPADRSRSGAHMAALAIYMGRVNIYATYWYLEATADLMRDIAAVGEGFIVEGGNHDVDCSPHRSVPR